MYDTDKYPELPAVDVTTYDFAKDNAEVVKMNRAMYQAACSNQEKSIQHMKLDYPKLYSDKRKWKLSSNKVRPALIQSLCENKQIKLMAMEFQKMPTKEFFSAIKRRVKDTHNY